MTATATTPTGAPARRDWVEIVATVLSWRALHADDIVIIRLRSSGVVTQKT
jgi:hypothetical protein